MLNGQRKPRIQKYSLFSLNKLPGVVLTVNTADMMKNNPESHPLSVPLNTFAIGSWYLSKKKWPGFSCSC